ncbi:integrase [Mesorhizobium sp. M8A.F.Ca.ET.207.01.1.1]|uniref:integrase n=1 Tax=Mesorhizobium sp. M8A.F.Ca.ET.207.01.1.1 TaxID=2563968 RepID=UPI00109C6053|nr:integrase [Mesorhizobium sp. M8A.F.Ca.ET.207.01.1.1]TGQ83750.1 integrase [Mesorhizobium sp. M8A.F.Ca.ET.207.01.1.1]
MPRPKNDLPTLKLRRYKADKKGYVRPAERFIYDGGKQHYLGIGEDDLAAAQAALREYVAKKHAEEVAKPSSRPKRLPPSETAIADAIAHYSIKVALRFEPSENNPGKPQQKRDFLMRMEALLDYWGEKVVDDIDANTCGEFSRNHSASTARRCLEDLRAAVKRYVKDRKMAAGGDYVFELPTANAARYGFFTRGQLARLVWAAHRKKGTYSYTGKRARADSRGKTVETAARPRRHIARFLLTGAYTGTRTDRIERASFYKEEGRPWVDIDNGIFYRNWQGEMVPDNKRAGPVRIPGRLLAHMRRWKANGARYVVEHQEGKTGSTASAFFRLLRETLTPEEIAAQDLNRHTLRHTCATWAMMGGRPIEEVAGYLETSDKIIRKHYGHHHPDHQAGFGEAFTTGRAGRLGFGRDDKAKKPARQTAANNPVLAEEVRGSIRDLLEAFQAPIAATDVLSATPDAGLEALRETVKRSGRSGDWSAVLHNEMA